MSAAPAVAYKVLTAPQMETLLADSTFDGAPVDLADGYIHLSTASQLAETLDKHFAGQADLHLVTVDLAVLDETLRWEPSRGGALFPHIYGPLPMDAVIAYGPLTRDADGTVHLPVAG